MQDRPDEYPDRHHHDARNLWADFEFTRVRK